MFDVHRIFGRFYSNNTIACGEHCCFFDSEGNKQPMNLTSVRLIQSRIMRYLYESGKQYSTHGSLRVALNNNAHTACQPERLSEKDFFPVSPLLKKGMRQSEHERKPREEVSKKLPA